MSPFRRKPTMVTTPRSFGRRPGQQSSTSARPAIAKRADAVSQSPTIAEPLPAPAVAYIDPADQDLEDWKQSRRFQIPWRPLSWMASLSFGIASFVLPASVNDNVQWLLYALAAASFCAGFAKRRRNATAQ